MKKAGVAAALLLAGYALCASFAGASDEVSRPQDDRVSVNLVTGECRRSFYPFGKTLAISVPTACRSEDTLARIFYEQHMTP